MSEITEWSRRLGEMHTIDSEQYCCPCVVAFDGDTADEIIEHCRHMGAIYHEGGPDDAAFVVALRHDIGPELWTEQALRRSVK